MVLQLIAVVVLGLMCGSELNVAIFAHPNFNRQPVDRHIFMRSSFAVLFGRVMPFWMSGCTLLNVLLLLPFAHLDKGAWRLAAVALTIQILAVVFSLSVPCRSTTGLQNGHRTRFPPTGEPRSIDGMPTIG